ncbi:hypothetical protein OHB36_09350 [Streptomyces sp. NBC_00320]|uniref:hypothetical protein n=1 Tax=Streptomyces sp. NBC_00320 TaxID=2975711 RepID=UPI0022549380|nr:hypothetical protein [Streptomyces sp. NBC_00320]MCX5146977.1 hypothetical protein [Streptomyces sp. NBC_00320]
MSDPQDSKDVTAEAIEPAEAAEPTEATAASPAATGAAAPEVAQAAAPRARSRRTVALIAGGLGVAVLAGGALWAAGRIADADRTSPTRYWVAEPRPTVTPEPVATVPPNELTGKLLPVTTDFELGPDLDAEGNDFYVSGERALQAVKDSDTGLSGAERAERDKALDGLKLKGVAGRSYHHPRDHQVMEIRLTQADPQTLAKFSEFSKKILELTGAGRDAPKIEGFPDAKCALTVLGKEKTEDQNKIDTIDCEALQGDVLVSFRMYGPKPLSANDAAGLFKQQLNHLKSPGESV